MLSIFRKIEKNIKGFHLIFDEMSDFQNCFDEYFCTERELFYFLFRSVKDVYRDKKVISFDIEKQVIFEKRDEKITQIKIKKSYQKQIEKTLITYLEQRRNEFFLSENAKKIKDFYIDFLGYIARFYITKTKEEEVFLELKNRIKKVPERLVFMAKVDDFLDQDMIGIGHHFMFSIKNVELKDDKIFVKMTRKRSEIIEKELQYVFKFIEKKYGKRIDFEMGFVDFKSKKIVIRIADETISPILKSVKKVIKSRLGFDIFWKIRGK